MRDVVVVGAGPVGLLLAGELRRHGIDVELLEKRDRPGPGSRAIGLHPPVLATLEPMGLTEVLLADAVRVGRGEARAAGRTLGVVRFDRLRVRFPFVATLPQSATERAFAGVAPAPTRGVTVTSVRSRGDRAVVHGVHDGRPVERRARVVVVAAGAAGRALVYRPSAVHTHEYRDRYLMTDAATGHDAEPGIAVVHLDGSGVLESFPLPGGRRRYVAWDPDPAADAADTRAERLRRLLHARADVAVPGHLDAIAFGVR